MVSNKIYDCIRIIPKGPKITLWFTFKQHPVLYSFPDYITLPEKKLDRKTKQYVVSYDPVLSSGTIVHGTLLNYKSKHFFFMEDVMKYKSRNVKHDSWDKKLEYMINILHHIRCNFHNIIKKTIRMGIPIIHVCKQSIQKQMDNIYYLPYSIEYLKGNRKFVEKVNTNITYKNFMIRADLKEDIYHLYNEEYIGNALIPNMETSKMMNSIFRTIKENSNLDLLEESDDDEEFENIAEDKYVDLDKIYRFRCVLHDRFNMWVPIERIEV